MLRVKKEFLKCELHNFLGTCFGCQLCRNVSFFFSFLSFFGLGLIFGEIDATKAPFCLHAKKILVCWCQAHYFSMWGMPYQVDAIPLFLPLSSLNQATESKTILFFCNTIKCDFRKVFELTNYSSMSMENFDTMVSMDRQAPPHTPSHPNIGLEFETLVIYDFLGHPNVILSSFYMTLLHDTQLFWPYFFKTVFGKASQYSSTKVNFNW